ncbi:hypothetical protein VB780_02800 [Leptolyngbya sp. CCNP1308]|uniref:hypothetical protein n=1 Tax=Leptolyngbya sp. CCNP1308 TaxID=3110255 RepID=UPI002B1F56C8|nr:hypothetical protein [Leptolyngbya sp. CCNP1308]MEA5447482.1 hypothetical protein [Leptolyngbya sp. CCNP1308]
MTNPVQDRVKTEWEKAQKEGGQRASRIREIVKAAAAEALAELRDGSSEIETQGRKTLAEMIDQLRANEAADAAAAEAVADAVAEAVQAEAVQAEAIEAEVATETDAPAPTWAQIFADLRYLANDRKVGWAQQILAGLQTQVDRFDADMATEYGDRYGVVRPLVRGFRSLVALAYSKIGQPAEPAAPTPVHIVVLDDVETPVDDSTNA